MYDNNEPITSELILEMLLQHLVKNEDTVYLYYHCDNENGTYVFV